MKGRPKSAKGCLATRIRPREAREESFVDRNLRDGKTAILYVFEVVDGEERGVCGVREGSGSESGSLLEFQALAVSRDWHLGRVEATDLIEKTYQTPPLHHSLSLHDTYTASTTLVHPKIRLSLTDTKTKFF